MIRVLHSVSVMDRGGQETFIMNVYRNIDRQKIQFDFLCSLDKKGDYDDEIRSLGGKIIYLDIERKGNKFSKYYYQVKNTAKFLSKLSAQYDIIHLHNYHAFSAYLSVVACKRAGFKNIILHSHNSSAPRIALHKIFKSFLSSKKITRYACSQDAGKWLHGNKKFEVIYNGVDTSKFFYDESKRHELRKQLDVSDNFVIGMVGRFNYQKNHIFALEVFKECANINPLAKLILVGKGELEESIKDKISQLDLQDKVMILGTRDDVDSLMCAFDVLLMPSIFEGLSVVLVEAQHCRLPIVASDVMTPETFFTTNVSTLSLNTDKKIWADCLLQANTVDRENIEINDESFDIKAVADNLSQKYCLLSKNNNKKVEYKC